MKSFILFRQVITPEDDTADWPAAEFELVSSCYDDGELGIFATNRPLKPTLELDWSQFRDENVFLTLDCDEAVVEQTPEEVIASWGYDPEKPSTMGDCFL